MIEDDPKNISVFSLWVGLRFKQISSRLEVKSNSEQKHVK